MERKEFIRKMDIAIMRIEQKLETLSCVSISKAFKPNDEDILDQYVETIENLFMPDKHFIDWDKLGILFADPEARIKFRIKLLKIFKEQ